MSNSHRTARIAINKQCGHVTSHFTTVSLSNGIPGSNCHLIRGLSIVDTVFYILRRKDLCSYISLIISGNCSFQHLLNLNVLSIKQWKVGGSIVGLCFSWHFYMALQTVTTRWQLPGLNYLLRCSSTSSPIQIPHFVYGKKQAKNNIVAKIPNTPLSSYDPHNDHLVNSSNGPSLPQSKYDVKEGEVWETFFLI